MRRHPKQEIACTCSFGHPVTELRDLNEAVTKFASRGAVKLRKQGSQAGQVMVFIRTSPFRKDPQYSRSITVPLRRPSADTAAIVGTALAGLRDFSARVQVRQGWRHFAGPAVGHGATSRTRFSGRRCARQEPADSCSGWTQSPIRPGHGTDGQCRAGWR